MSLSDRRVTSVLRSRFVCGARDIAGEPYAGRSGKHDAQSAAVRTTNGAGPHNMQLFVLAADGTVLHCLPGYWGPADLVFELRFAEEIDRVRRAPRLSREAKEQRFRELHLAHIARHPQDMVDRSVMQGFDKKYEKRRREETSDTILRDDSLKPRLRPRRPAARDEFKTTDQIMHERMAARPFVAYDAFDTERFADYGRPLYDKRKAEGCTEHLGEPARPRRAHTGKRDRPARERRERPPREDAGSGWF